MKTLRLLCAALLMTASCMCALAQGSSEIGDAYYIYRNDGDFNGFFYDRVQEMRFSKLDLDSVEHEQYVVQEVVTPDSIYRIPMAAIDSVSFIQPEIILNPNLYLTSARGLDSYIYYMDESKIWVEKNTPENLIPKVGDVLVCPKNPYSDDSWDCQSMAGKVTRISELRNGICIMCDEPIQDLHDVFVQFITTEQLSLDDKGNTTRRIARRKVEGGAEVPIIDLNGNLKKDIISDVLSVTLNYGFYLAAEVDYHITWDRFFIKTAIKRRLMAQPTLTATGKAKYDTSYSLLPDNVPTPKIIFPVECPILQFNPLPKIFFKAEGSFNANVTLPNVGLSDIESFTISDNGVSYNKSMSLLCGTPTAKSVADMLSGVDGKISMEGFLYAGVMAQIGISSVDWAKKAVDTYIGVDVFLGPKVSANMELSLAGALTDGSYGSMLGSNVTISPICLTAEAKATWKFLWTDPGHETFADYTKGFFEQQFFLIPSITRSKVAFNKSTGMVDADFRFDRKVLFDSKPGIEFVKLGEQTGETFFFDRNYTTDDDSLEIAQSWKIDPGNYRVRPICDFRGTLLRAGFCEEVIVTPYMKFQKHDYIVDAPEQGKTCRLEIPFESNAERFFIPGEYAGYDIESKDDLHHVLAIDIQPTNSFDDIERLFDIWGYGDNTAIVKDTIRVLVKRDIGWIKNLSFSVSGESRDQDGKIERGGLIGCYTPIPCSVRQEDENLYRLIGVSTETTERNSENKCGWDENGDECYNNSTHTRTDSYRFNILLDVSDSQNYIIKEAIFDYSLYDYDVVTSQSRPYLCGYIPIPDRPGFYTHTPILQSDVGDYQRMTQENHATLREGYKATAPWTFYVKPGNVEDISGRGELIKHDPYQYSLVPMERPDETWINNWTYTGGDEVVIEIKVNIPTEDNE
ncbi:MAG: hypothetical protein KBT29_05590 [Prevotellaceae bacterium]|nr:hypothetical protein [Candidatus Minthosoma caballi]